MLRLGMELTYPPFETQDKAGQPDGVGVKLAEAVTREVARRRDLRVFTESEKSPEIDAVNP